MGTPTGRDGVGLTGIRRARARILLGGLLLATAAVALLSAVGAAAPTLDDQVYAIAKDLMCPVCAGQTVADSNAQLAVQMREEIRKRLLAGQSREEIVGYFINQFGEGVLAAPPARGTGLVLWLVLPVAFLAGVMIIRAFLRQNLRAPQPAGAPPPPTREEAEQIVEALRRLDDAP